MESEGHTPAASSHDSHDETSSQPPRFCHCTFDHLGHGGRVEVRTGLTMSFVLSRLLMAPVYTLSTVTYTCTESRVVESFHLRRDLFGDFWIDLAAFPLPFEDPTPRQCFFEAQLGRALRTVLKAELGWCKGKIISSSWSTSFQRVDMCVDPEHMGMKLCMMRITGRNRGDAEDSRIRGCNKAWLRL